MLAKSRDVLPSGEDYLYEIKLDGQRTIAEISRKSVLLYTRNFQAVTDKYPELDELRTVINKKSAILDGEIVALRDGIPSFELLQQRMNLRNGRALLLAVQQVPIIYYAFDVLKIENKSLMQTRLVKRKELLQKLVTPTARVKVLPYFESRDFTIDKAIEFGYEGVVAKKRSSFYYSGQRTDCWVKQKFQQFASFVICGWLEGGRSNSFGSLLIGDLKGEQLSYAGRVGTGFTESMIAELMRKFHVLSSKKCPFARPVQVPGKVHWLKPKLRVKIKFKEWTNARVLRAPVYVGLTKW